MGAPVQRRRWTLRLSHGFCQAVVLAGLALSAPAHAAVTRYLTGSPEDVSPSLHGPVLQLAGGGPEVLPATQVMIDQVRGCTDCKARVDVVVLRATADDYYNAPLSALQGVDSVETLVVSSREEADSSAVEQTVRAAEVVFFAGGDQCNYVRFYAGTRLVAAVKEVWARGGGVGGTSAGSMIQGEHVYDACSGSATSAEALADPYAASLTLSPGLFAWGPLAGVLVDSHFLERNRLGRLMAFLARQLQQPGVPRVLGLGVSESTSVLVDAAGQAQVMGKGPVFLLAADHPAERCRPGESLTFSGYRLWRLEPGDVFSLPSLPGRDAEAWSVTDGQLSEAAAPHALRAGASTSLPGAPPGQAARQGEAPSACCPPGPGDPLMPNLSPP